MLPSSSVLWTKHSLQVLWQNLELSFIHVPTFTCKNEQGHWGSGCMSTGWLCLSRRRHSVWALYFPFHFVCFRQSYTLECRKIERLLPAVSWLPCKYACRWKTVITPEEHSNTKSSCCRDELCICRIAGEMAIQGLERKQGIFIYLFFFLCNLSRISDGNTSQLELCLPLGEMQPFNFFLLYMYTEELMVWSHGKSVSVHSYICSFQEDSVLSGKKRGGKKDLA